MKKFQILVKVPNRDGGCCMMPMRATGAASPYVFDTREEAVKMADMCYPSFQREPKDVQIVEVDNG